MIRSSFLSDDERRHLTAMARRGRVEHRIARRANAIILLDRGMSCEEVASVLLLDDDTIRTWHRRFQEAGVKSLKDFDYKGSASSLTPAQQDALKAWVTEALPRTTHEIGAWIEREFGVVYESRGGLAALLNRLGLAYRKPKAVSRKLDPARQRAFIDDYETVQRTMGDDETALFVDAVHPTHGVRPVGCWAAKDAKVAIDQAGTASTSMARSTWRRAPPSCATS